MAEDESWMIRERLAKPSPPPVAYQPVFSHGSGRRTPALAVPVYGHCAVCGTRRQLRLDGMMPGHYQERVGTEGAYVSRQRCSGGENPPGDGLFEADKPEPPRRVQRERTPGWTTPPNTVYVGRPSRWGNPYAIGYDAATAEAATIKYATWLGSPAGADVREAAIKALAGRNLMCWCPLGAPCHADILLRLVNPAAYETEAAA